MRTDRIPMQAPVPKQEQERLAVSCEYEISATVREEIFGDMTDLPVGWCCVSLPMFSLANKDRLWFKARVGIDAKQTARDIAFCAHAILQDNLFIVEDTTKDPRFASNPLVTQHPKIRFYAGAPLVTPDGFALGTLCVMDYVPRRLNSDQQRALQVLARLVMTQLVLRRRSTKLVKTAVGREENSAWLRKLQAQFELAGRARALRKAKMRTLRKTEIGHEF